MFLSYLVWGLWLLLFLILEFLGLFKVFGWVSLSETAWSVESLGGAVKILFLAGLVVLTVHIVARWP